MSARVATLSAALVAAAASCTPASPVEHPQGEPAPLPTGTATGQAASAPDYSQLPVPTNLPSWTLPKPEIFALSNGMRVYFEKQGPTPLVSILLVVPRGSATDPKGKAGLTSLTADLLDEGAAGKDALTLGDELQRLGTDYSASTDVDSVTFTMNTIAENLAESARLLSDIVRRPNLDFKEFQRRKDQRIAEALANESEPTSARAIVQRKVLFGDGYAGSATSGVRSSLSRLTLPDVEIPVRFRRGTTRRSAGRRRRHRTGAREEGPRAGFR